MTKAKNNPVARGSGTDATDIEIIGGEREIDIQVAQSGAHEGISTEAIFDPKQIDMEAFMAEELTVTIHPTQNKSEADAVYIGHQLTPEHLRWKPRNRPIKLKRYEVDILCKAKGSEVKQKKERDEEGFESYRDYETTHLAYPFRVEDDPNPRGRAWLREQLSRPY